MSSATSRMMPTLRRVVLAGAAADRTDGQLLGAFVTERDADAFAGLVRRHGPMVLGVCRRVTGDHAAADDAFQAVFIVLARRAGAVKPREQVGNWLYGVAYRTALKARAVLARRRSREKQVDVMPERPVSKAADVWSDLQPVIDEELARLPDKLRLPVVLCDLEGRAQRDVAKQLGIPPATLATRLATARRTLATRLTKRGVTLSGGALAGLLAAHGTATAVPHTLAHGVARAAEAVAGGNGVSALVSAHAVQLSEGVMRMMLLTKLKAVAVTALIAVALTGGLGLGLVPAYAGGAGNDPAPAQPEKAAVVKPADTPVTAIDTLTPFTSNADEPVDDPTFLRRLSLDLRGTLPTPVEMFFFTADEDPNKRAKLLGWLIDDGEVKAFAAKKLGVPVERVRLLRAVDVGTGKVGGLIVVVEAEAKDRVTAVAFSADGATLAAEVRTNLNTTIDRTVQLAFADDANARLARYRRAKLAAVAPARADALWLDLAGEVHQLNSNAADVQPGEVLWTVPDLKRARLAQWLTVADGTSNTLWVEAVNLYAGAAGESDVEFLKRVIKDVRGTAPTALEEKYFAEDKDPKKREKLLDTLLKDPAVAKKLGDDWKKKMLAAPAPATSTNTFRYYIAPSDSTLNWTPYLVDPKSTAWHRELLPYADWQLDRKFLYTSPESTLVNPKVSEVTKPTPPKPAPQADKFEKLVGELLAAKKSDAEMLEAVTLAVLGRLPTDAERKLTLGLVAKTADRKAAWLEVAKALGSTEEGKKR
jgi:RNA polymerase sigma factor (sigma-70 family)